MKEKVDKIIKYTDQLLDECDDLGYDDATFQHLNYVKSILQSGQNRDESTNIAKIHEAIHYIEAIKIKNENTGFFNYWRSAPASMADFIKKNNNSIILPESERAQKPPALGQNQSEKIAANTCQLFGSLHLKLIHLARENLHLMKNAVDAEKARNTTAAWTYEYPLDNGQVMNQAIGEWQAVRIPIAQDKLCRAYKDFERNISIRGMIGKTAQEITDLITYMVSNTNYIPEQKDTITTWLQENGGQDTNRFLDLLLLSGEYTNVQGTSLCRAKALESNWTIEKGKVVFIYETVISALLKGGDITVKDGSGALIAIDDPELLESCPPIMIVKAKIELNMNEQNQVVPQITSLHVTSYSTSLTMPDSPAQECVI